MTRAPADRRSHARFPRNFEIHGIGGGSETVARMVAQDLSLGGLYCSSPADFPEMTRLAVRLMIPEGDSHAAQPLDLEAVVVRRQALPSTSGQNRFELALFFSSMSDVERERLARFIAVSA